MAVRTDHFTFRNFLDNSREILFANQVELAIRRADVEHLVAMNMIKFHAFGRKDLIAVSTRPSFEVVDKCLHFCFTLVRPLLRKCVRARFATADYRPV